jgi:hypothetical protein
MSERNWRNILHISHFHNVKLTGGRLVMENKFQFKRCKMFIINKEQKYYVNLKAQ